MAKYPITSKQQNMPPAHPECPVTALKPSLGIPGWSDRIRQPVRESSQCPNCPLFRHFTVLNGIVHK